MLKHWRPNFNQVHAESGDIIDRNSQHLLAMGVTGPEGFYLAHSEAAEEEATMRATALASQVRIQFRY